MRISYFVPKCTPDNSHGRYVVELASRLGTGHAVRVYSGAFWPPLESVAQCRVVPVPVRPAIARLASLWMSSLLAPEGRAADIVHVQGADAPFGNVVTAHSCNPAQRAAAGPAVPLLRRFNYQLGAILEKYCLSKASTAAIIAVSQKVKDELEREYAIEASRISVIHHGVDCVSFHPDTRQRLRPPVRHGLQLAPEDFVVAFVGGDYRLKGLESLIEAIRRLPRQVKILAAGVRMDARLRSLIASDGLGERVKLLGHVDNVATSLLAASDCFALPTRYDTFSLATLEAMATGLPVVVTRAAGVAELLTTGHDSLVLSDPSDLTGLVNCLERLFLDARLRASLGANARHTAERHTWNEVARQTIEVYSRTVGG